MKVSVKNCEKIKNGYLVEVEPKDILYIDGKGGQLGDRGKIEEAQILEVKESGVVVDRELEYGEYEVKIDYIRQKDIALRSPSIFLASSLFIIKIFNCIAFFITSFAFLSSSSITSSVISFESKSTVVYSSAILNPTVLSL